MINELSHFIRHMHSASKFPEPGIGSEWRRKSLVGYSYIKTGDGHIGPPLAHVLDGLVALYIPGLHLDCSSWESTEELNRSSRAQHTYMCFTGTSMKHNPHTHIILTTMFFVRTFCPAYPFFFKPMSIFSPCVLRGRRGGGLRL